MMPARFFARQDVAGEIELMQALHDDDLYAFRGIIDPTAEGRVKAQVDGFALDLADGLLGVERIVEDEDVAAETGGRGLHAGGEHGAALRVFIMALEILIFGE